MIARRSLIVGAGSLGLAGAMPALATIPYEYSGRLTDTIAALEVRSGGRLGVAMIDPTTPGGFHWRSGSRFPMCSTIKFLLVAAVLQRVDAGRERLQRTVPVKAADILSTSPVSQRHVGGEVSLGELCDAVLRFSDNTGANLLLKAIGGPGAWTAFARSIGDGVSRSDRFETMMSQARPGDPRDTTTPAAMARNLNRILLGDVLTEGSRQKLIDGMKGCTTGLTRLRAGLPQDWVVADRTGTGGYGTCGDIAIAWPPGRGPILIASYLTQGRGTDEQRNAIHAEVGRAVARALG
jgi:beta-lactamase class A